MIIFLTPVLFAQLYFAYKINNKNLVAPSCLFTASFCLCSIFATLYAKKWSLSLETNTFFVICGGVMVFIMASWATDRIDSLFKHSNDRFDNYRNQAPITIDRWKYIVLIVIDLITIVYSLIMIRHFSSSTSISTAIGFMRDSSDDFPTILSIMRLAVLWGSYWSGYIIADNYVKKKRVNVYALIIMIMGMVSSIITGGRTQLVNIVISFVVCLYMVRGKVNGNKNPIRFKTIIKISIATFVFLFLFQNSLEWLGRTTRVNNPLDYLTMYCGAEIKNLDSFLLDFDGNPYTKIFGGHTFDALISWLGHYFGLEKPENINIFRFVNGYALGNVYTTFYAYIYDFGYAGVVSMTALMAVISQLIFKRAKRKKMDRKPIYSVIIYGYISSALLLSFFSNKFYEQNFSVVFARGLIVLYLLDIFCFKIRIGQKDKPYNIV